MSIQNGRMTGNGPYQNWRRHSPNAVIVWRCLPSMIGGLMSPGGRRTAKPVGEASSQKILLVPGIEYSDASTHCIFLVWGMFPSSAPDCQPTKCWRRPRTLEGSWCLRIPAVGTPGNYSTRTGQKNWSESSCGTGRPMVGLPAGMPLVCLRLTHAMPFAGLDFHDHRQFFPLSTDLEIESSVTEASVLAALRSRRCHSKAFGFPLENFSRGISAAPLRLAGFCRRKASSKFTGSSRCFEPVKYEFYTP